jgi:DNA invertase Pin-like site-specific DNA recombinase
VSQFERALIRERQREGFAKALKAGKMAGRHKQLSDEQEKIVMQKVRDRYPKIEIAKEFGISRTTLYKIINRHKAENEAV